ncbi:heterokaryon incompatibility protein-domain-containing protein [Xylariomycetidae sp. FL0641]|nr:heterokaryon incompatibility protein-domain-containing protein [Xylariomycetidae sp. FL0641]
MSSELPYTFDDLPVHHIRVMDLQPGNFDDDLYITLRIEPFDQNAPPHYEALSYAWGTTLSPKPVRVAGTPVRVIEIMGSLDEAMRYLRYSDRPRSLWIDALCINQGGHAEKGHQVASMGHIYRLALRVIVWLGPENDMTNRAISVLENLGSQVHLRGDTYTLEPSKADCDPKLYDESAPLPLSLADQQSLHHLLFRPWFDRLWVRQEILMASEAAIVLCGRRAVPWRSFRNGLCYVAMRPGPNHPSANEFPLRYGIISGFIALWRWPFPLSHIHKVGVRHLKCKDPRDRLYGFLSLLTPEDASLVGPPDYGEEPRLFFERVVRNWIDRHDSLSILVGCALDGSLDQPSWIPNWSSPNFEPNTYIVNVLAASSHFGMLSSFPNPGQLKVMGVSVGELASLSPSRLGEFATLDSIANAVRTFMFSDLLSDGSNLWRGFLEAFARILGGGRCFKELYTNGGATTFPNFNSSVRFLEALAASTDGHLLVGPEEQKFLTMVHTNLRKRSLFKTREGSIGIALSQAEQGDRVCILLSCRTPMLLRPVGGDHFRLDGPCYIYGASNGEPLLGPLPEGFIMKSVYDEEHRYYYSIFLNEETGTSQLEDPRLRGWPIDHESYERSLKRYKFANIESTADEWLKMGIKLESFTLV